MYSAYYLLPYFWKMKKCLKYQKWKLKQRLKVHQQIKITAHRRPGRFFWQFEEVLSEDRFTQQSLEDQEGGTEEKAWPGQEDRKADAAVIQPGLVGIFSTGPLFMFVPPFARELLQDRDSASFWPPPPPSAQGGEKGLVGKDWRTTHQGRRPLQETPRLPSNTTAEGTPAGVPGLQLAVLAARPTSPGLSSRGVDTPTSQEHFYHRNNLRLGDCATRLSGICTNLQN